MKDILEKVKSVAREAGEAIMERYEKENEIMKKEDKTLVTEVDLLSEKIILEGLAEYGYGVLSEEKLGSVGRVDKKRIWVIDPIDGTMDFIKKTGEFSVMIGLVENGKSILGVVYQPSKNKMYYATLGGGAFLEENGEMIKLSVSKNNDCTEATMLGSRHHMKELEVKLCGDLGIVDFVTHGSAGLKICLIAEQEADIYINSSDKTAEWDICAADVILSEAGGKITDMSGDAFVYNRDNYINLNGFVCTNSLLHDEIIKGIKGIREV